MISQIYTIFHVLISLVAIFAGSVVLFGMLSGQQLDGWTKWFLITAIATTLTPTQTEPPFKVTQLVVLLASSLVAIVAVTRFRPESAGVS
ncbi:MAG: hypothetical protein ACM3KL_02995 [Alphaproteobacteria bacterium]